ncbi:MAG: hypothetical protein ACXVBK_16655 [Flavisolibacter sp.]
MTLYDFVQLTQLEKATIVFEAQFLSCKEDDNATIVLYKVHDFFCEVVYDNIKNSIVEMKPFRSKELVDQFFAYQMN